MAPIVAQLVARARASGELRSEIAPQDFPMIQIMLGAVIDVGRDAGPGLWRRYLELLVQGMRAQPQSPPPLSVPAPGRDRMQSVLSTWRPPRRA